MTTIVINSKSKAAKDLIDYLKKQPFVKVIEEKQPTKDNEAFESIKQGLKELNLAKKGKLTGKSAKQFLSEL